MSLSSAENRRIDALMEQLEPLKSLKSIAEGNITVTDIRIWLDAVIDSFPDTTNRLTWSAAIVQFREFESANVKTQNGKERASWMEESNAVSELLSNKVTVEESDVHGNLSFVERVMQRRTVNGAGTERQYLYTWFLIPGSNVYKGLFSMLGTLLSLEGKASLQSIWSLNYSCFWNMIYAVIQILTNYLFLSY